MDRVKFGRALGYGARHAAKTLAQAVEAASSPDPRSSAPSPARPVTDPGRGSPGPRVVKPQPETLKAARRQAQNGLVAPVMRFSNVVWLQVTGLFFGLIAFAMGTAAWRARAAFHAAPGSHDALKLYSYLAVCALFSYFTISSFVRASRR